MEYLPTFPRDPITLSEDEWGVESPPKRIVFRFHYHSEKVIGSLGIWLKFMVHVGKYTILGAYG